MYLKFSDVLKRRLGTRVQKLSVDGGFSCPNRDGAISTGGCTFCDNSSFSPDYCRTSGGITSQIKAGMRFFGEKYPDQKYLVYFQSYSSTYASDDVIRERIEEALAFPGISGVVVGTRPDVISDGILDYFEDLASKYYVEVEYGVESTDDAVLARVNRGHGYAASVDAVKRTAGRGIVIGAHMIMGLPGESREGMVDGVLKVAELPVDVLKLHQLQIIRGTAMAAEYQASPQDFNLFTQDSYIDLLLEIIGRLPERIALERFVNQVPPAFLIAPRWGIKNHEFVAVLEKKMKKMGIKQGKFYVKKQNKE